MMTIQTTLSASLVGFADIRAKSWANVIKALGTIGVVLHRYAGEKMGQGGIIDVRTGTMKRALFGGPDTVDILGDYQARVRIGGDLEKAPYWRIQELGGVVEPKNAAHLAIPLDAMLTDNGVARGTARDVIASPGSFGFTGTFTAKDVIFGKLLGPNYVPLFALKESVTLEAREILKSTLEANRLYAVQEIRDAYLDGI